MVKIIFLIMKSF